MDQRYEHILYRNIKNQIDTEKKKPSMPLVNNSK